MNDSYHFEAHKSFIRGVDERSCRDVRKLTDKWNICIYSRINPTCREEDSLIHYMEFIFCNLTDYINVSALGAICILLSFAIIYAIVLAIFTLVVLPNIVYVAKYMGMNEYNAGVTVLIMVNGIPKVIKIFFFFKNDTEMHVNEMMGIRLYLAAFHAGLLIFHYPTHVNSVYFIRDMIAYLFGLIVVCRILSAKETSVFEGIVAMIPYPVLILVVYIQNQAAIKERLKVKAHHNSTDEMLIHLDLIRELNIIQVSVTSRHNPLHVGLWKQFLLVVNPLRSEVYGKATRWQRILFKGGIPIVLVAKLLVPVIDLKIPGHGWSRVLVFINIALAPLILVPFMKIKHIRLLLVFSLACATLIFILIKTPKPSTQFVLAMYGIGCQMLITKAVASEVAANLVSIGNVIGLKRSVTGTSLLAWGNTVPEIVAYMTLTHWNMKTMPIVALLFAPLLSMVFSLGLTTVLKCIDSWSLLVMTRSGDLGQSGLTFTVAHYLLLCFAMITTNFQLRRSWGIFSMLTYMLFLIYLFLYQYEFIHAYGTDHIDEQDFLSAPWA